LVVAGLHAAGGARARAPPRYRRRAPALVHLLSTSSADAGAAGLAFRLATKPPAGRNNKQHDRNDGD